MSFVPSFLSLDLGFGHTKGMRGKMGISFPSVTGSASSLLDQDLVQADPIQHMIDKKRGRFVGDLALRQSSSVSFSLKEEKADHAGIQSIIESSLALLTRDGERGILHAVTGLPMSYYFKQKEQLQQLLHGRHDIQMRIGQKDISRSIYLDKIKQVPQPLGSAMDFLLEEDGSIKADRKKYAQGSIGVLDIGFFTKDLLVLDRMEVISKYSRSLQSGMSLALMAMNEAGLDLPIYLLDKRLRAGDFAAAKRKAFQALADQTMGELETYLPDLDLLIVTGGGGLDLFPYMKLGADGVTVMDQMANVRGYGKIGRRAFHHADHIQTK